ncbi:hypothetical protein DRO32_01900, partial [Candidatus Bathyarchaeota archaeon]
MEKLNVEVKARVADPEEVRRRLLELGAEEMGTFLQTDTYFLTSKGRLKLREVEGLEEAELIYYERRDEAGPRACRALVLKLPRRASGALREALPVRSVVKKSRTIFRLGPTEIHLDEVEGLGSFLELEVKTGPDLGREEALGVARELLSELGVDAGALVPYSYGDMVAGAGRGLRVLWAPWRMAYITRAHEAGGCLLCRLHEEGKDEENKIIYRGRTCFIVLNIYPYNTGHVMVAPYRHVAYPTDLTEEEMLELWETVNMAMRAIEMAYSPHGFNIGMNIGRVAGAGVEDHLHVHVVPRWLGDTNFMPVL